MSSTISPSDGRLLDPQRDRDRIRAGLAEGRRLVACLCAGWCSSCSAWSGAFADLAREWRDDCFVWIDIEDHDELVASIELETLPVLLIQSEDGVAFVGPIEPRASSVRALLARESVGRPVSLPGPDVRTALLNSC